MTILSAISCNFVIPHPQEIHLHNMSSLLELRFLWGSVQEMLKCLYFIKNEACFLIFIALILAFCSNKTMF